MLLEISTTLTYVLLAFLALWVIVLITSIISLYQRKDLIMPVKLFWMFVLLVAPVMGLICYLVFGTKKKSRRN